jgi:putative SOS response-associated peptidase YedK
MPKHTINARAETLLEKPAFRGCFRHKRGAVPATGFYEWRRTPEGKRTRDRFHFTLKSGEPFFMAALWDTWCSPDGSVIDTASIITTEANDLIASIHNRMPAMLTSDEAEAWIMAEYDPEMLQSLLRPIDASRMTMEESPAPPAVKLARTNCVQTNFEF